MASGQIGTAYIQVVPSMEGVAPEIKKHFDGAGESSGASFGSKLAGTIKKAIAAAGIGKALKEAITAGADLQQLKGGVEKIFNDMDSAAIMADAANAYKDLNMSANQYLAVINDVGAAFAANMGDEKGYSVAKTGLQAISDYASGTGKNVDELSQKFTMITRSTSSYQSIADQFSGILPATSAGFLEQAQAAGYLSGEYKKLTDVPIEEYQQAVSEMLQKGTAELGLAGNTAAETATTFSGSLAAMKAAATNLLGNLALGEDIGPSLQALGDTVFTFVTGNLLPMVGNALGGLPEVISAAFGMAIQGLNLAATNAEALVTVGIELGTALVNAIVEALSALPPAVLQVCDAVGNALSGRIPGLTMVFENMETVVVSLTVAMAAYKAAMAISGVINALKVATEGQTIAQTLLNAVMNANPFVLVATLVAGLVAAIVTLWNTNEDFRNAVSSVWSSVTSAISAAVSTIVGFFTGTIPSAFESFKSGVSNVWNSVTSTISSAVNSIVNFFSSTIPSALSGLVGKLKDIPSSFVQLGKDIISGIARGISAGVGAIISAARQAAAAALNAAKRFLGIASPSKVMRDQVGKFIPEGVAVGIESNTKPLMEAMHDLSDLTTGTLQADLRFSDLSPIAAQPSRVYGDTSMVFHVYASENQDVDELVEILMQKIQIAKEQREAALSNG